MGTNTWDDGQTIRVRTKMQDENEGVAGGYGSEEGDAKCCKQNWATIMEAMDRQRRAESPCSNFFESLPISDSTNQFSLSPKHEFLSP